MESEKKVNKGYCYECNQNVDYTVKRVKRKTNVRGVDIKVETFECFCEECGGVVYVEEYEKKNDIIVNDAYKEKVHLLTSAEMKAIRAKRGMSQVELARFLNIGEKDIARYESGAIQTKSIDRMIRMVGDDITFYRMALLFGYMMSGEEDLVTGTILNAASQRSDAVIDWGSSLNNMEVKQSREEHLYVGRRKESITLA